MTDRDERRVWPWTTLGFQWDGGTLVPFRETVWPEPMTVRWSDDSLGAALWQRLWRPMSVHVDDATFLVVFNDPDAEKSDLP